MEIENTDPQLDMDALQKSLDELVQVADATELHKAYGGTSVEYSGRFDEDGKGGGGGADSGDVGGLDKMMIAKMSDAGIPSSLIGDFLAFMAHDDEEEEEEEEAEKGGYEPPGEPLKKALEELREDPDIADAVDVSPFLEGLVGKIAEQIDGIRKSGYEQFAHNVEVNRHLAVALHQIGSLAKGQQAVIHELGLRLGLVEAQPASLPRGATDLAGAQALSKGMPGEAGGGGSQLTKNEVLSTLTYMNLEKSIKQINGQATYELACMYDGGAEIDGRVVEAVQTFLATHPHEADQARNYA